MDRASGKLLDGWDHVAQSVRVIFTTPFFERVMRGYVGSHVIRLLGEPVNEQTIMRVKWGIAIAIDLFEPRLTPYRIDITDFDRTGASSWVIQCIYRPNALSGDMTPAGIRTLAFDPEEIKQAIVSATVEAA